MKREDFQTSDNGVAYLALLDEVAKEPGFKAELEKAAKEARFDPWRAAQAAVALKEPGIPKKGVTKEQIAIDAALRDSAILASAECILQERNQPKLHKR